MYSVIIIIVCRSDKRRWSRFAITQDYQSHGSSYCSFSITPYIQTILVFISSSSFLPFTLQIWDK